MRSAGVLPTRLVRIRIPGSEPSVWQSTRLMLRHVDREGHRRAGRLTIVAVNALHTTKRPCLRNGFERHQ